MNSAAKTYTLGSTLGFNLVTRLPVNFRTNKIKRSNQHREDKANFSSVAQI